MAGPTIRLRSSSQNRIAEIALALVVATLATACLAGFWRAVAIAGLKVPLDPNEGWNAYHAAAAIAGYDPYPAAGSFMTNNYPPLSFYVVGILGKIFADNIVAGRVVSLISFATVVGGIWLLARRFGCDRLQASLGAAFFAGFLLLYSDYVGMDDPQMLGHALQMGALLVLSFSRRPLATEASAAALFVAGIFVKHNLIAMPLATLCWLFLDDRKSAARLAVSMLALGLGGLLFFRFALGFDLLSRLKSARSYSLSLLVVNLRTWMAPAALPLAATFGVGLWRRDMAFCALYALAGTILGGALLGGAGVDANAMFDADIAVALGTAIALNRLASLPGPVARFAASLLALAATLPLATELTRNYDSDWLEADFWLHPMRDDAAVARKDIAYLRARPGQAMCEMLSLCYWAGKAPTVDMFNLNQQFQTGSRATTAFVQLINDRAFAVLQFDSLSAFPFPEDVKNAVLRSYRIDRENDDGVFLVPR